MISRLFDAGHWLWNCIESAVEAVELWFLSRQWEMAVGGLPACVAVALLLIVAVGQRSRSPVAVAEPYRQEFRAAVAAKDYDRAEFFVRKLTQLNLADDSSRFEFAKLSESEGKPDDAREQISALAPPTGNGFPSAHLWMADLELRRHAAWTEQDRNRCLHHLTAAKADSTLQPRAAELLGFLHLFRHDFNAAIDEFRTIESPTLNTLVAQATAFDLAGRREPARIAWSAIADQCQMKLALALNDNDNDFRLILAIASSHLRDYQRAEIALSEGLAQSAGANDRRLKEALDLARVRQLSSTTPPARHAAAEREKLLEEVHQAPESPSIALRLLRWPTMP